MTTQRGAGVSRSLEMPRTAGNQQKMEEARKDLSEGVRPRRHLGFRLLDSRTVRE